jgi:hypothetical protein
MSQVHLRQFHTIVQLDPVNQHDLSGSNRDPAKG